LPRGARRIPAACLRELERAELILHAGDFVAASVLADLRRLGPVEAVHGNIDEAALREDLPTELVTEAGGVRIGMVHDAGPAAGREERLARRFHACAAVVYGHTHLAQVERTGGVWILNPGSPTEGRRSPAHTFLVVEIEGGELDPTLIQLD
jgi:putative phosphoesterase